MRVLLASLTLLLAACGFQPMYAQPGGQNAIGPVTLTQIDGMAGHVLRAELDRILQVENDGSPPALLEITLTEQVTPLGIRVDESAARSELRLIANYVLTPPRGARQPGGGGSRPAKRAGPPATPGGRRTARSGRRGGARRRR